MNTLQEKKRSKGWLWIVGVLLLLLVCCCIVGVGGYFYLDSRGATVQDLLPGSVLESQGDSLSTQVTLAPTVVDVPESEAPPAEADKPLPAMGDHLVVVTDSGVWLVDEGTGEAVQLTVSPLDAPWDLNEGMSPKEQSFAYLTGFGGASISPYLIVLDLAQQTTVLEVALTGPLSTPGIESIPGDPAFEATRAMESAGSLAWSPDGRFLAFSAAMDGDSADVYLYDSRDSSVTRLSDEMGHASDLHWSPDGRLIEYVSVESFGTGAGMAMVGLWAVDMQTREAVMLERLESGGEDFLGWADDSHFLIHSWGPACSGYNMRIVDAASGDQETVVEGCFSAAAYNPRDKVGLMSVADFNVENCMCGTPLAEAALYALYEDSEPVIMWYSEAYDIEYLPEGNVFAFQPVDEPYAVYSGLGISEVLPPEVTGLKPFPASPDGYWAWYSEVFSDASGLLWVTLDKENPVLVTSNFSGTPAWGDNGQTIFYIEHNQLYKASAPDFVPVAVPGVSGELKDVVN